jgi:autotransporter-associated beta strand protein
VTAFRIDALNAPGTATSITNANTSNGSTVHGDSRDIAFDASGRLLLSSDGTIYARTNAQNDTGAWTRVSGNLSLFESARVAYDAVGKRLTVAAQDNGVTIQAARNSLNWNATRGADGINAFVNDVTLAGAGQTAFYGTVQNLDIPTRIVLDRQGNPISPDANVTCNGGTACNAAVVGTWFSSPWVNNRVDPTRMALGGNNVYVTQDTLTGAQAPTVAAVDLTLTDLGPTSSFVTRIAYGTRDNPNFVLVGAGNGIWQSTTAAAGSLVNVPAYAGLAPSGVVSDPRSQNRYFVADNVDLFGTTNQGTTFITLTGNLPTGIIRPTAVEFISNNGVNALLVGSLGSVANLQSTIVAADSDAAGVLSNWRLFGNGLPNTQVNSLSYNEAVDVLAVGTFGRGVFTLYDVTSYFPQATVLQFGLADNDSMPDASFLTNGTSASRQLIKYGIGTLTIAGDATYTGGTTINGGAVVLGVGGSSGSILGNVTFCNNAADPNCDASNNKALAFNRSDTYTFGGTITGPGQVFQIGNGKTVLTGASDYTGPTFVNAGTLSVNGSITSSVFVDSGGTLGGNGSVGATTILPGGALSPGNSVGLITVNGNLVFNPGSLYFVEIFGNTADRTNVTGTAILAGTVVASFTGGTLTNSYTILSAAGGRTGTFDSLAQVNAPAFITASLAYTPTDVLLNLNSTIVQTPGLTSNEAAVAPALDASFNSGRGTLPGLFGLSRSQLAAAMDALSGEGTSGTQQTAFDAADMFMSTMMDQGAFWRSRNPVDVNGVTYGAGPMQYAASRKSQHPAFKAIDKSPLPPIYEPRWRAWTTGFGGVWKLNGEAGIGSATHDIAGGGAGLDYQFTPDILLGLAAGGSSSNFAVRDRITSGHLEAAHFGGYGVKTWGSFYTAGALSFNTYRNDTSRTIVGVGPIETAAGNFGSNMWSGRLELGYKAQTVPTFSVTPFVAVQFSELRQNGYTETNVPPSGAGVLGLSYASRTVSSLPTFVGTQIEGNVYLPYGLILSPYGRFSWVHEFKPNREINPSFIALPGTLFTIDGARAARDAARVEIGSKLAINRYVKAFINYEGEYSQRSQSYAGKAGFSVSW